MRLLGGSIEPPCVTVWYGYVVAGRWSLSECVADEIVSTPEGCNASPRPEARAEQPDAALVWLVDAGVVDWVCGIHPLCVCSELVEGWGPAGLGR